MSIICKKSVVAIGDDDELYCRECVPKGFWSDPFGYDIFDTDEVMDCCFYICDECGRDAANVYIGLMSDH